jgi:hypothetical protein
MFSLLVIAGSVGISFAQSIGGVGAGSCEPGGAANIKCPYWDVEYEYYSGFPPFIPPSITITCTTGGQFTC